MNENHELRIEDLRAEVLDAQLVPARRPAHGITTTTSSPSMRTS